MAPFYPSSMFLLLVAINSLALVFLNGFKMTSLLAFRPSDDTSRSKTVCDEVVCRMTRSVSPSEMMLLPCSDYTVRVGSTNLKFTTFPGIVNFKKLISSNPSYWEICNPRLLYFRGQ